MFYYSYYKIHFSQNAVLMVIYFWQKVVYTQDNDLTVGISRKKIKMKSDISKTWQMDSTFIGAIVQE